MEAFLWNSCFITGLADVDEQHHRLVDLINRFGVLIMRQDGASITELEVVFAELADYARYHFAEEEKLLATCGYPDLEEHQEIHRGMVKEVLEMRQRYLNAPASVPASEALDFLSKWLMRHIIGKDLRYRSHAENHGA